RLDGLDLPLEVRSVMAAQRASLGDASIPAGADAAQRRALEDAVAGALVAGFRAVAVLAALLALRGARAAPPATPTGAARMSAADATAVVTCPHIELVVPVSPRSRGCEECLRLGARWVHLRLCLSCGHVGCCDASKNRHATAHFWATQHPIVGSLEPDEAVRLCHLGGTAVLPGNPRPG